jgi:hypothetical protein
MIKKERKKRYNSLKEFNGQKYTGMAVGGNHSWNYEHGTWNETKISPNSWKFEFISNKYRIRQAPIGTGALNNTQYHWYIIADQKVNKIDANTYSTTMTGLKYKVAHRRPNWNYWSNYYRQETYEEIIIRILEETIEKLKAGKQRGELINFF